MSDPTMTTLTTRKVSSDSGSRPSLALINARRGVKREAASAAHAAPPAAGGGRPDIVRLTQRLGGALLKVPGAEIEASIWQRFSKMDCVIPARLGQCDKTTTLEW
jgi:hypothetical protein